MEAALITFAVIAAILLTGLLWQSIREGQDAHRFPPPGTFIESAGSMLHVYCTGQGQPVVVLEAGIAASSVGWARVAPVLAAQARVCVYDRPGLAWSPLSARPRTPEQFIAELSGVVGHAGTSVVLVGHSFGALLTRLYASKFPHNVRGLVLVDPALLLEWAHPPPARTRMLHRGVSLSRRGAILARIGFVRLSLSMLTGGARKLPKLLARLSGGRKGAPVTERLVGEVRKLPAELWPVVQSHWVRARSFRGMAEHLASLPAVAAAVQHSILPPDLPLTVISGSHLRPEQLDEHRRLADSSSRGKHIVAEGSGHWVHLDRPELIVQAVAELLRNHG